MLTDTIHGFMCKHKDEALVVGIPAVCVLAFALLEAVGAELIGSAIDYMLAIMVVYIALIAALLSLAGVERVYSYVKDWQLRVFERRLREAELEARAQALEPEEACSSSQESC